MKHIVVQVAVLVCLVSSASAGVDKYCETYKSKYFADLGKVPAKTFIPVRFQVYLYPTSYDGMVVGGVYQPVGSENKFAGPTKLKRTYFDSSNKQIFKEVVKDRKPNVFTNPNDPTKMKFGYSFSYQFKVDVGFNYYCFDELWVKKPNRIAVGEQSYTERYEGNNFDCSY